MCIWHEELASHGPEEIGSCLRHYVRNLVKTPNLIMCSGQYEGQNRSKMAAICTYTVAVIEVQSTTVVSIGFSPQLINHKFLILVHSYLF